jgi:superfamily II DNA or RNA helicase
LTKAEQRHLSEFFDLPSSALTRLGQDQKRNLLIVSAIAEQIKAGRKCVVFACSVEHSKLISAMLNLEGIESRAITADSSKHARARAIHGLRYENTQALVNFGILTTGFDSPNIGAVVIARPTASIVLYSQMIGRGLRGPLVGGQSECVLVDVVDNIEGFGSEEGIYEYFDGYWE